MKASLKKLLQKIFTPLAFRLGFRKISPTVPESNIKNDLLEIFFTTLIKVNFTPKHIVDVGANHGAWTRETMKYFPDAYYTLIEPQQQLRASVDDILQSNNKVKFYPLGAGKKAGSFKFTIAERDDSCSFMFSDEEARKMGYAQIEIPVVTLNDFLPSTNLPEPDIIKIDAEGLDLEVLSGADNYFRATEIFMVEAGVMNKMVNNGLLEIITFMDKNGYRLFEITDLNRTPMLKVLWLVELVFIKKDGIIDNKITSYN
jgi:FkbM family methyltransferase